MPEPSTNTIAQSLHSESRMRLHSSAGSSSESTTKPAVARPVASSKLQSFMATQRPRKAALVQISSQVMRLAEGVDGVTSERLRFDIGTANAGNAEWSMRWCRCGALDVRLAADRVALTARFGLETYGPFHLPAALLSMATNRC